MFDLGANPTLASLFSSNVGASELNVPPPCIVQVALGAAYCESSVSDCPLGTISATFVVVGQFGVGNSPLSLQTVTVV